MSAAEPSFVAFRRPVDRKVFEPGFREWQLLGAPLRRLWHAIVTLPDRGRDADEVPPEFFQFPPY